MSDVLNPMDAAADALADGAKNTAKNMAMSRMQRELKGVLPRFLWPLIPGVKGTVAGEAKKAVKKRIWAAIGSCVFSIFFFSVVGVIVVSTFLFVVYAILTS